jgi:hypothetical protein
VHELDCDQPKTMKELLDIATRHTSGEEVVAAIFIQDNGKVAPSGIQGVPLKAVGKAQREELKATRGAKAVTPTSRSHYRRR